jgi:peptidoglycan/LPS O-acetylase OafA/YrhL
MSSTTLPTRPAAPAPGSPTRTSFRRTRPGKASATRSLTPAPAADRATPARPPRDRALDVARAGALGVVVLWHWVFSTVSVAGDGPHVGSPVGVVPGLWALTWVLQIMPLFFLVGGAVNAGALDARGPRRFVRRRLRRLLVPAVPLLIPAVGVWAWASATGHSAVASTIVLVVSPLWFAATYAALAAIAPLAWRAQRRHPVATPIVLAAAVLAVDVARFVGGWDHPLFFVASFVIVWAAVHQLGFAWTALRSARRRTRALVALGGYTGLALCVFGVGYPASMVGVYGERVSNMSPPDLAVVFLGIGQLGVLALGAEVLERFAARRSHLVDTCASWSMTVFVWHLLAWVMAYAAVRTIGIAVPAEPSATWWLQRPLWLVAPALIAVPLCGLFRRFDRSGRPARAA